MNTPRSFYSFSSSVDSNSTILPSSPPSF